ncbi:polysaccharide biosynthesis C-terminal domain-containing protein [Bacteroidota bacterium]
MAKRSYFQDIASVFGSNLAVTASNLLIGIMLSRILGAAGFGIYSSIIVVPIIVIGFTQFGIRRSTIYHIGNKILPEENIISALFLLLLWASALSIIICGTAFFFYGTQNFDPLIIGIVLLTIPLLLANVFAGGIFLGKEDIANANIVNASPIVLTLLFTVLFVWVIPLSVLGAFMAIGLANLITFIFVFRKLLVKSLVKINWKYQEPVMKSMIKLGLVNAIAIFVMQLNYRMDILMLKQLSTFEQVGYYSLATQIAEQLWHIPFAIEMIILSRSANTSNNEFLHKTVASIFRVSLIIGVVLGTILFFMAPIFVPMIFGKEFIPTITMIRTILPGVLILVGFRILNSRLTGMGKPQVAIYTFVPALLINFILNLILLPKYGGVGAAWATNVSYAIGSIAFLFAYARVTKMSALQIFTFRKSDFYFFRDLKQYVLRKRSRQDDNQSN